MAKISRKDFDRNIYDVWIKGGEQLLALLTKKNKALDDQAKKYETLINLYDKGQKKIDALTTARKGLEKVTKDTLETDKATLKLKAEQDRVQTKLQQTLSGERDTVISMQAALAKETAERRKNAKESLTQLNAYEKLTKETNKAQAEFKKLAVQYGLNDKRTRAARKEFERLDNELREVNDAARDGRRVVGMYGKALEGVRGTALRVAGTVGLGLGFNELINLTNEQDQINKRLTSSFQLQGKELENTRKQVQFLAQAYDKDVNEVIQTANVLTNEFKINQQEAFNLLDKGFAKGADVRGEFLEQLNEYATQFVNVGLSAEEAIAVITQQEQKGVFSDKGVDAIKEAGLRLTELTPAAETALNMIGISGTELQREITSGQKTVFEATQEISREIAKLPPNSKEVGTVLADVFGGAGEDAKGFVLELGNVSTNLNDLKDQTSDYEKAKQQLIKRFIEIKDEIAQGLVPVFQFLAQNLGTVLGAIARLGAMYLIYRSRVQIASAANFLFNGGLSSMLKSIPNAIRGLKGMSFSIRSLGTAMKTIPFVAIISGLVEMVSWLWQTKDATEANTAAERKLNDEYERGNELRKERIGINKDIDTQFKNRNSLSQQELAILRRSIEAEIELGEQRLLNLSTAEDQRKAAIKALQEELALTKGFSKRMEIEKKLREVEQGFTRRVTAEGGFFDGASLVVEEQLLEKRREQLAAILPLIKTSTTFTRTGGEFAKKALEEQIDLLGELNALHRERLDLEQEEDQAKRSARIDELNILIDKEAELQQKRSESGSFDLDKIKELSEERLSLEIENIDKQAQFEIDKLSDTLKIKQQKRREELEQQVKDGEALQADLDKLNQIELAEIEVLETEKQNIRNQAARDRLVLERENIQDITDLERELTDKQNELYEQQMQEHYDKLKELADAEAAALAKRREQWEKFYQFIDDYANKSFEEAKNISQERQELLQSEIDAQQAVLDATREAAIQGNANAQQSLKAEEEALEQKKEALAEEQRREEIVQQLETFYSLVNSFISGGDSAPVAIGKAGAQTLSVKAAGEALFNLAGAFWEGTDWRLGAENTPLKSGRDGHLVRVDSSEGIVNKGLMDMAENAGFNSLDQVFHAAVMAPQLTGSTMLDTSIATKSDNALQMNMIHSELKAMRKDIQNKKEIDIHPIMKGVIMTGFEITEKSGNKIENYRHMKRG